VVCADGSSRKKHALWIGIFMKEKGHWFLEGK